MNLPPTTPPPRQTGPPSPDVDDLLGRAWALFDRSARAVGHVLGRAERFARDVRRDARAVADDSAALYGLARRHALAARGHVRSTPRFARVVAEAVGTLARYRAHEARAIHLEPEVAAAHLEALHASAARRAYLLCVELGGGVLKAGQLLSCRRDLLPAPWAEALAQLQDRVPAEDPEVIAALLADELGEAGADLVAALDPEPLAAGSLAQVHRATLPDGRAVAVKIQRPGVGALLEVDVAALRVSGALVAEILPRVDTRGVADELDRMLAEELDFVREAEHLAAFAEALADDPRLTVPGVHLERSSARVLVMDLAEGERLGDFLEGASAEQRDAVLGTLVDTFGRQILALGLIHGDPHPGNFLVRPSGDGGAEVVLLDLGCVRRLDAETRRAYAELVGAGIARDPGQIVGALRRLGFRTEDGDDEALSAAIAEALAGFPEGRSLLEVDARAETERFIKLLRTVPRLVIPDHFVVVGRVLTSLGGLMLHYRPRLDLTRLLLPHLAAALRRQTEGTPVASI